MATITRSYSNGKPSETWKVQFRRKGIKSFCLNFNTYEEAVDWAKKNEFKFIENPEKYFEMDRLKLRRKRERDKV